MGDAEAEEAAEADGLAPAAAVPDSAGALAVPVGAVIADPVGLAAATLPPPAILVPIAMPAPTSQAGRS